MKKSALFVCFLITGTIFMKSTGNEFNELIVFDNNNNINFINESGNIIKKIQLKYQINYDFIIKNDIICYIGSDKRLHWYNFRLCKEFKIPDGPYIYRNKNGYGPERYNDIDFSQRKNIIVFSIVPEYSIEGYGTKYAKRYEHFDLEKILFFINLKDKTKGKIYKDNAEAIFIYKNYMIISYGLSIILFDPANLKEININELLKESLGIKPKNKNEEIILDLYMLKIISNEIIFYQINNAMLLNNKSVPLKIYSYNLDTRKISVLHEISNTSINNSIFKTRLISDISKDKQKLLLENKEKTKIFIFDLIDKKEKNIYTAKNNFNKIQFYRE